MSAGDSSQQAINSYLAVFRESTWGTYPASAGTNAAWIPFISCNVKSEIKKEKLDTIGHRGFTKQVTLEKSVQGTLEAYLHPEETTLLVAVCLGGGVTSASLTGAFLHSIAAGNIVDTAPTAVSFNFKKGDICFQYVGGRVDNMKITAKVGEPAKVSFDMVFKDSTIGTASIAANQSYSSVLPFTFVQGVFRYNTTETTAATTTAEEPITGFELTVKNNLKADAQARKLGSALLAVLPPTRREIELKVTQRFDTTTTYDRFVQNTQGAIELKFTGAAITAEHNYEMTIRLPKVFNATGDTEVGGSGDILTTDIMFDAVLDSMGSGGREIGITVKNNYGSYTSI